MHSRRQDPAADAESFLPALSLERLAEHLEIWPVLVPVEINRFWHHFEGRHNQSSRGFSPTCVIKFAYKLLTQYFVGHSFD